jgi:predicted peroxiredoxin
LSEPTHRGQGREIADKENDMVETVKKQRKKFAVQLSSGINDIGKVKSAIMFATIAQCSGCDAVVYCVQDGADAVVKGKIREEGTLPPGVPSFEQRLAEALQVGVRFQLCEQVAKNRGLTKDDLIDGTQIAGGIHLITYALEYDGMLYF